MDIKTRDEWISDLLALTVGLPVAFAIIVWRDMLDHIDDVIWKLKNRRG
ncbi:hypothetical protein O9X98_15250 [Agrobacterium salinitolerans]|nr:hypothetical protein [Agrobacterium salinitolerans]